jgi:hypothetical protein
MPLVALLCHIYSAVTTMVLILQDRVAVNSSVHRHEVSTTKDLYTESGGGDCYTP